MTKPLSHKEKKDRKEKRKQQKAKSATVKTVTQPKPEEKTADQESQPVNLCDDCAYEFGECEGKPKFVSDQDETLTGAEADRVIECPAFVNVAKLPTAQEAASQSPAAAEAPGLVIVCSGGCGKTTESIISEATSGEFKEVGEGPVPEWTCQECLDKREESPAAEEPAETQVIRMDLPERPDPKRFQAEEDFGTCQSCEGPLKRTAFNRYRDAVRCTNGRCRAYRAVVKAISTGVK